MRMARAMGVALRFGQTLLNNSIASSTNYSIDTPGMAIKGPGRCSSGVALDEALGAVRRGYAALVK